MAHEDPREALTLVVRCRACDGGQHIPEGGCVDCAGAATAMHQDLTWNDLPSHVASLAGSFGAATFAIIVPCGTCGGRSDERCGECLGRGMHAHAYPSGEEALADLAVLTPRFAPSADAAAAPL